MPTFTPPLVQGMAQVGGTSHPLWRHFGNHQGSASVWRDPGGAYHSTMVPYHGGGSYRSFNNGLLVANTVDDVNKSLANATEVYLGGSVYPVDDAKAAQLRAAGFFVGGHWESEEDKWTSYVLVSEVDKGFKAGDATAATTITTGSMTSHADTGFGTVDADGFVTLNGIVKNSVVLQDLTGVITSQIYAGAGAQPAWHHPLGGVGFTVMDLTHTTLDPTSNVVAIGWSEPTDFTNPGMQGIVMTCNVFLGADTFSNVSVEEGKFFPLSVYNDTTYHYILGRHPDLTTYQFFEPISGLFNSGNIRESTRLARVPIGQIMTIGNWQWWDGDSWTSDQVAACRVEESKLQDIQGFPIEGLTDLTKVGSDYIIVAMSNRSTALRLYKSKNVEGPYTLYHTAMNPDRPPDKGPSPPLNTKWWNGFPKFQEHKNPDANHLVVSHSHQVFVPNAAYPSGPVHASIRRPNFVFCPVPSIVS